MGINCVGKETSSNLYCNFSGVLLWCDGWETDGQSKEEGRCNGMNPDINEIILRSRRNKEPMDFERLKFLCWFVAGMVAEGLGFILALIVVLCMAGAIG